MLLSLEQDQQVCQYFGCQVFEFQSQIVDISLQNGILYVVENKRIFRINLSKNSRFQKSLLENFSGEIVTKSRFNKSGTFAYFVLEKNGGRVQRLACLDIGQQSTVYSKDLEDEVKGIYIFDEDSPYKLYLQFKKKIGVLDFESDQVKTIYHSRHKIKFFGCWGQIECLVLNESRMVKFISQDGKILNMIEIEDSNIKSMCSGNSFCVL